MQNFTHQIPTTIHFGKGQISHLTELKASGSKVLLVYGGGSIKKSGIYDEALEILKSVDLEVFELSGVDPNPRIESVRKGAEICKKNNIDMVLAIGGGSVIDCAKVVAGAALYDGDAWDLVKDFRLVKRALPIYSVLTLAATGSEMDTAAVISDMTLNDKLPTFSPCFLPTMSICDPTYTFSVSKRQTASGTADIMSHTLESYFNNNDDAFLTNRFAESILLTCIKYGPLAIEEPDNYEARANLMWASSNAINGFIKAGCNIAWCVHPMEHELSAFYDITHGIGLAILTPHWMRHVLSEATAPKFAEYGINVWGLDSSLPAMTIAEEAIEKTAVFFTESLGIPATLRETGITDESKFEIMAEKAAASCKNAYVPLTKEDVLAIFKAAF